MLWDCTALPLAASLIWIRAGARAYVDDKVLVRSTESVAITSRNTASLLFGTTLCVFWGNRWGDGQHNMYVVARNLPMHLAPNEGS